MQSILILDCTSDKKVNFVFIGLKYINKQSLTMCICVRKKNARKYKCKNVWACVTQEVVQNAFRVLDSVLILTSKTEIRESISLLVSKIDCGIDLCNPNFSFTFCNYPFVLSLASKHKILQRDQKRQMMRTARDEIIESVRRWLIYFQFCLHLQCSLFKMLTFYFNKLLLQ